MKRNKNKGLEALIFFSAAVILMGLSACDEDLGSFSVEQEALGSEVEGADAVYANAQSAEGKKHRYHGDCDRSSRDGKFHKKGEKRGKRDHSPEARMRFFEKLDADGDGAVSLKEAEAVPFAQKLVKADVDEDGLITKEELEAAKREHHGRRDRHFRRMKSPEDRAAFMLKKLDADNSGSISVDELEGKKWSERIIKADSDGNGEITVDELKSFRPERRAFMKRPAPAL